MNALDLLDDVVKLYYTATPAYGPKWEYYPTYCYTQSKPAFPPENIAQDKDNKFIEIKMAVAGFKKEEIEIETEDEFLVIKGKLIDKKDSENIVYIQRNLKAESFERAFSFPDSYFDFKNPEVKLEDGVLTIRINKNPDFVSAKKKITIN